MKKYTLAEENCVDVLQLHLFMTYSNFTNEFDKLINNYPNYSYKAELLDLEGYIFCLCFLSIRLKMLYQPINKITAENLVNIQIGLLTNYYDNYIESNYYIKFEFNELFKHFKQRYVIYENKMKKGIENFIKSYMFIVNHSITESNILKKYPLFEPKNIKNIGDADLYIKTVENIETIIKLFFDKNINAFYENKDKRENIDYFHSLDKNISEYI